MSQDDFQAATELFVQAANRFHLVRRKMFDHGTGIELFPAEVILLGAILKEPGLSVSQLSTRMGYTTSAGSQTLKKLEARGLITLAARSDNRKIRRPELTEAGTNIAVAYWDDQSEMMAGLRAQWGAMSSEHQVLLVDVFRGIVAHLDAKLRGP